MDLTCIMFLSPPQCPHELLFENVSSIKRSRTDIKAHNRKQVFDRSGSGPDDVELLLP